VDETELKDDQEYIIGTGSPPAVTDIDFTLNMSGHSNSTPYPQVGDFITNESCNTGTGYPTTSQACSFAPDANGVMQVKISGYTKLSNSRSVPNGCVVTGNTGSTVTLPVIVDYNVSGGVNPDSTAAILNSTTGDRTISETAVLYFKAITNASTAIINFTGPTYWCPSNYSPSVTTRPNNSTKAPDDQACTNGGTPVPTWSTTLVQCPAGTPGI
jgi:hypothetical protein